MVQKNGDVCSLSVCQCVNVCRYVCVCVFVCTGRSMMSVASAPESCRRHRYALIMIVSTSPSCSFSSVQYEICRALLYATSRSTVQWWKGTRLSHCLNVLVLVMSCRPEGRLFQGLDRSSQNHGLNLVLVFGVTYSTVLVDHNLYLPPAAETIQTQSLKYCGSLPMWRDSRCPQEMVNYNRFMSSWNNSAFSVRAAETGEW